jgi:hypothetical protein
MITAKAWKCLAGVVAASGLLLTGAGVSAATTTAPTTAPAATPTASPDRDRPPEIDCATAEHLFLGLPYHMIEKKC